jgi:spore coat polysaccharide biosynthesis protein SpsF
VKIGAIIEARMKSNRLPGKVLCEVRDVPMLGRLVNRLKMVPELDEIIVATTVNPIDDTICDVASKYGASFFRGHEENVLSRVLECATFNALDIIVEVTGDCPIVDPEIVSRVITAYFKSGSDYVSNAHLRSYPDGMDVQVYRTEILRASASMVTTDLEREHVTLHIRNNPDLFSRFDVTAPEHQHWPELGLTLDTAEDLLVLTKLIEALEPENPTFGLDSTLEFLRDNKQIQELNKHILRRGDT